MSASGSEWPGSCREKVTLPLNTPTWKISKHLFVTKVWLGTWSKMSKRGGLVKLSRCCDHACIIIHPQTWKFRFMEGRKEQTSELNQTSTLTPKVCVLGRLLAFMCSIKSRHFSIWRKHWEVFFLLPFSLISVHSISCHLHLDTSIFSHHPPFCLGLTRSGQGIFL